MIELDFGQTPSDQQTLERFAQAIASNTPFNERVQIRNWCNQQTVINLANRVSELTDGKRTVRQAAQYLFNLEAFGPCLYLACCASDTPDGEVTELADDTVLIMLSGSLMMPIEPASPETIAKGQRSKIEHDSWHRDRQAIADEADQQVSKIKQALVARVQDQATDQNAWTSGALYGLARGNLQEMLVVCKRLNISFDDVVREALTQ